MIRIRKGENFHFDQSPCKLQLISFLFLSSKKARKPFFRKCNEQAQCHQIGTILSFCQKLSVFHLSLSQMFTKFEVFNLACCFCVRSFSLSLHLICFGVSHKPKCWFGNLSFCQKSYLNCP